jgi:hypothetical protein
MANLASIPGKLLSFDGNLLSDSNGCGCCAAAGGEGTGGGCGCPDGTPCSYCADATPSQFHVTFAGIMSCAGCVDCGITATSLQVSGSPNGTYLLAKNGPCSWTVPASSATATFYTEPGCAGPSVPAQFGIDLTRISATQFRLQISDGTNTVLLFNATITLADCCTSFIVANQLTACGCDSGSFITAGTSGSATLTVC